jgi:hypothetical protein
VSFLPQDLPAEGFWFTVYEAQDIFFVIANCQDFIGRIRNENMTPREKMVISPEQEVVSPRQFQQRMQN